MRHNNYYTNTKEERKRQIVAYKRARRKIHNFYKFMGFALVGMTVAFTLNNHSANKNADAVVKTTQAVKVVETTPVSYTETAPVEIENTDTNDVKTIIMDLRYIPELYMPTICGETSGATTKESYTNNDNGNAYGIFSFDYRYDLVDGMNYLYDRDPELWSGFQSYLNCKDGSSVLKSNSDIANEFITALRKDYRNAISDQLNYMYDKYFENTRAKLDEAGYNLENRNVAVSAAILSISVNCGDITNVCLKYLNPNMTDEEMIDNMYYIRNTVLSKCKVGSVLKGTNGRFRTSEIKLVKDILNHEVTVDSTDLDYGNGVEWKGNVFEQPLPCMTWL